MMNETWTGTKIQHLLYTDVLTPFVTFSQLYLEKYTGMILHNVRVTQVEFLGDILTWA